MPHSGSKFDTKCHYLPHNLPADLDQYTKH